MVGPVRPIDRVDAGEYFAEYQGMLVRDAECPCCLAQYLAWVKPAPGSHGHAEAVATHYDLSFRSTFNDEPGERDLPRYTVKVRVVYERTGPWGEIRGLRLGEFVSTAWYVPSEA